MSERYKVRMSVLALVYAEDDIDARDEARLMLRGIPGLTVIYTDNPELMEKPPVYRDDEDVYP